MSMAAHDASNFNVGLETGQYPPQSAQNQATQGIPTFADSSGHISSMYMEAAAEEDKNLVESWKAGADGILIFTGLFSAAVASFISVSIQDIRPNPQDTSNFYLANIYQAIADPNQSNISSSLPATPPPFSPPNYAVWVNTLWFMSFVISLTCALLATLLQQWARRYLKVVTQPRYSPHKRARIRAFFAEGVDKLLLSWAVEALPTLLHISLFLFFAGLAVFLCNVELTTYKWVVSWVSVCAALYGCITLVPIFRHDSPYHTPLSLPVWHIVTAVSYVIFRFLRWFTNPDPFDFVPWDRFDDLVKRYGQRLLQGMQKTAEETALHSPSEIVTRAFMWTFDSLDEDHELERFFFGFPGFRNSKVVEDPLPSLTEEQKEKLSHALRELLYRTFTSRLLHESIKIRRAIICAKAIDPVHTPDAFSVIYTILGNYRDGGPLVSEIVRIARGWRINRYMGRNAFVNARATICMIVARVQPRDDSWFILASTELGVPESVLRNYATHGDSLSLAILIHITRQHFSHFHEELWPTDRFSDLLKAASKLNAQDTSRELQHEFCALWNQIVRKAQKDSDWRMASLTLRPIRDVYTTLHQDTDSAPTKFSVSTLWYPSAYPLCKVAGHHPDSTPHNHINSASAALAHPIPHDSNALLLASSANIDAHSSFIPVVDSLTDNPHPPLPTTSGDPHILASLDPAAAGAMPHLTPEPSTSAPPLSFISPPTVVPQHTADLPKPILPSSNPVLNNPLPAESHHSIVVTPPDPVTARVIRGGTATSTTTIPLSTPDPLLSTPPPTSMDSTSPPGAVAVQNRTTSARGVPSPPSPTPVLNNILPTDPQPSLNTPATVSNHVSPSPESRSSRLAPAAPGPSRPLLPSVPDLGAAAEGESSAKAASHKALDPPSAVRENMMAAPDLPQWSPSPLSVDDAAIAGPSWQSLGAEYAGDPPHPSHGQYDIV